MVLVLPKFTTSSPPLPVITLVSRLLLSSNDLPLPRRFRVMLTAKEVNMCAYRGYTHSVKSYSCACFAYIFRRISSPTMCSHYAPKEACYPCPFFMTCKQRFSKFPTVSSELPLFSLPPPLLLLLLLPHSTPSNTRTKLDTYVRIKGTLSLHGLWPDVRAWLYDGIHTSLIVTMHVRAYTRIQRNLESRLRVRVRGRMHTVVGVRGVTPHTPTSRNLVSSNRVQPRNSPFTAGESARSGNTRKEGPWQKLDILGPLPPTPPQNENVPPEKRWFYTGFSGCSI